jgi:hypothetical protein
MGWLVNLKKQLECVCVQQVGDGRVTSITSSRVGGGELESEVNDYLLLVIDMLGNTLTR